MFEAVVKFVSVSGGIVMSNSLKNAWGGMLPIVGALSLALLLAACGGGGGGDSILVPTDDFDGDGLTNGDETTLYFTSPRIADTDGDGFDDFDEVITKGFNAGANPYRFNPLIADLPKLEVEVQQTPVIGYKITSGSAQTADIATTRGTLTSTSRSTSLGGSVTVGVEASTSASASVGLTGPSASVEQSVTVSASSTISYDSTTTTENQSTWNQMRSSGVENSTSKTGGYMRVNLVIRNTGNIAFTIQSLKLSSTTSGRNEPFGALANLEFMGTTSPFPVSLSSAQSGNNTSGPVVFSHEALDLTTVRTLLNESRSISVRPNLFELTDGSGNPVAFQRDDVDSRTAKVLIDFGGNGPSELHQVSTNNVPGTFGHTLAELLNAPFLSVPHTTTAAGLATVRTIGAAPGRWVINRVRDNGTSKDQTLFDPDVAAYSLASINVLAGDEISLVYLEDPDGDGLGYREEILNGTDPAVADTDGDGLSDFEEVRTSWTVNAINAIDPNRYPTEVYSSPVDSDYDGDNVPDNLERQKGLDPFNDDTDGDTVKDDVDPVLDGASPIAVTLNLVVRDGLKATLSGALTAIFPRVVASATIDWGDGSTPEMFTTAPGGNPSIEINPEITHTYAAAGAYTVTVNAANDATTPDTVMQTSTVRFTQPSRITGALSYNVGWRTRKHIREVVDINGDGFDDIVGFANVGVHVALGSASGFAGTDAASAFTQWSSDWGTNGGYPSVDYTRLLVDIDGDGDLDIVGVNSSGQIHYAVNNSTGAGTDDFGPKVLVGTVSYLTKNSLFVVDVDNNALLDIVHIGSGSSIQVFRQNTSLTFGASPALTAHAWPSVPSGNAAYPDRTFYPIEAADLDGDNCADLMLFGYSATYTRRSLCNGSYAAGWTQLTTAYDYSSGWRVGTHKRFVTDINNDGKPDIIAFSSSNVTAKLNTSTVGTIGFSPVAQWSSQWGSSSGWKDNFNTVVFIGAFPQIKTTRGIYPRYMTDVDGDGYQDIVGFGINGLAVSLNQLGSKGLTSFAPSQFWLPTFNVSTTDWFQDSTLDREYFPRTVGDLNGDGKADFIGFDRTGTVFQNGLEATPFQ